METEESQPAGQTGTTRSPQAGGMDSTTKMMIVGVAVLVVIGLLGAAAHWYITRGTTAEESNGETIDIADATRDPTEALEQANPFGQAETNPFSSQYKNPFE